jgi:hypothetical protein
MRMASATGFMGVVTYITVQLFQLAADDQSFLATFPKFIVIVVVSLGVYLFFSRLLKLGEAEPVIAKLRSLLFSRFRSE